MGLLDRISSVTSGISNAVDAVENKVSDAVDTVENKVSSAVDTVETGAQQTVDFAKSEFKQATDYAKATGQKLENAASSAYDQAKSIPLGNPLTAGAKLLEKLQGKPPAATNEGEGLAAAPRNSGDPNQPVDLSSKENIQKFLASYGQNDRLDSTNSDESRCQSNVMVAGLLLKGGPEALQKGLVNARADAAEQLKTATGPKKTNLENALKEYDSAIAGLQSGKPTQGQLDGAADALFHTMSKPTDYKPDGSVYSDGADPAAISKMEKTLGLTGGQGAQQVGEYHWYNPAQVWTNNNQEVANNIFAQIPNGSSAHVGVNLFGEAMATGKGPNGEPVQKSDSGEPYYIPKGLADSVDNRQYLNKPINHAVLFGKNSDGTRYIYNPNGNPPYLSEKKGDKASSQALDTMAADLISRQKKGFFTDDYGSKMTNY